MGFIPPPPPLTRQELKNRVRNLEAEGKPVNLFTVDPELAKWQRRNTLRGWIVCIGTIIAFTALTVFVVIAAITA